MPVFLLIPRRRAQDAEGLCHHGAIGGIGPRGHRGTSRLEHDGPLLRRIRDALRISLAVADAKEEVYLVACLVHEVGDAVAALADAEIILCEASIRQQIGQQHVVDVAHMCQMAVPVEGVGMSATHLGINRIPRQTVLPEVRLKGRLEVRLVPHVATHLPPVGMPGMQIRLIDREPHGVHLGDKLRLTRNGVDVLRVNRFAQAHVVIAPYGVAVGLEIDIFSDSEVHATTHVLHHQAIASCTGFLKINIPDVRAYHILLISLLLEIRGRLPEADITHLAPFSCFHVIKPYLLALE